MTPRTVLLTVVALASVPMLFVGACLILAIGAGVANYQDDVADRETAAADSRLQRPLDSTSGRILFIAQKGGTDDFHVVNVDGSGLTQLTHLPKGSLSTRPIVSPDQTRMVINTGGGVSILPLDRPGELVRLDSHAGSLAWSPNGTQLASLSIDAGKRLHLYQFDADGGGEVRDIAAQWPSTADGDEQSVADLVWSPDGKRLAFVLDTRPAYKRFGPRHRHLYITPADGSGLRNVSLDPTAVPVQGNLAWSPDGRRLAFASATGLGLLDADMNWSEIPIALHESRSAQQPAWSPDGTRLAWFSPDSVVVSDLTGGNQRELTRGRCRGVKPSWSGDGSRIAFVCPHDTGGDLWVLNADGSGLTRITHFGEGTSEFNPAAHVHPSYSVWLPSSSPTSRP
jgi:Tol biopolymer transport system component